MTNTYRALLNGYETTAKKINNIWFVGGDRVTAGQSVQIQLEKEGRAAWFSLKGCFLTFSDFVDEVDNGCIKTMTATQEMFNHMVKHLKEQGRPARDADDSCKYRLGELKCAVGACIPDKNYCPSFENRPVLCSSVMESIDPKFKGFNMHMAFSVQSIHDNWVPSHDGRYIFNDLIDKLTKVANLYLLTLPKELMPKIS